MGLLGNLISVSSMESDVFPLIYRDEWSESKQLFCDSVVQKEFKFSESLLLA